MAVIVRRAVPADAEAIAGLAYKLNALHVDFNPRRFSQIAEPGQMANFYASQTQVDDAAVLVAEIENEIVGFAYIQFEKINYAGLLKSAAWLHDIYINDAARRQNAGKLLIDEAVKTAKELGADKLMLSVASANGQAQKFFERQGFEPTMIEMMLDLAEK